MPGESISFDITASGDADRKFRQVGDAALIASGKVDVAAASLKVFDDTSAKMGKAATTSTAAMKASTKALAAVAEANRVVNSEFDKSIRYLKGQSNAFDDVAKKTENAGKAAGNAAGGFSALAGGGGLAGGGIGALVAAGVALSPVVLSLGVGLAGLGAAAYGVAKPIENAAQKTGGLSKNLHLLNPEQQQVARSLLALGKTFGQFQQALQPTVFQDFNAALRLARNLMGDVLPVSTAVGHALAGLIGGVDKTFQTQNWKQFFDFLARTAGPDVHDLTSAFTNLLGALPPIVEQLAPLTAGLLKTLQAGTGIINLASHLQALSGNYTNLGNAATYAGQSSDATNAGIEQGIYHVIPALSIFEGKSKEIAAAWNVLTGNVSAAGKAQDKTAASMNRSNKALTDTSSRITQVISPYDHLGRVADTTRITQDRWGEVLNVNNGYLVTQAHDMNRLAGAYTNGLGPLEKYINAQLAEANDLHSLKQALKASGDQIGYNTQNQRNSFAATQQYIQQTIQTGNAAISTGHGIQGQIDTIQRALPVLENVKGKTAAYKQELDNLKGILDALRREKLIQEKITVTGRGTWNAEGLPGPISAHLHGSGFAAGGKVPPGFPNDSFLVRATSGEAIIDPVRTRKLAPVLGAAGVPGFAGGGIVGGYGPGSVAGLPPWISSNQHATIVGITNAIGKSFANSLSSALATRSIGGSPGPGGGNPSANAALAYQLYAPRMTPAMWTAWNYVAMRESGWNQFARNPSSGAYGIAQALPPTKYPFAGQAAGGSNPRAQITWMWNYMMASYGGPVGAAAHEQAFNWYDRGGWLKPGLTLAYNGTGRPEMVIPNRGGQQALVLEVHGGSDVFDQFMMTWLRKAVRLRGGNVQLAFGRN